ncbi:hypothetical protein WA158_004421 [Blastocystis sp. Blastoise]
MQQLLFLFIFVSCALCVLSEGNELIKVKYEQYCFVGKEEVWIIYGLVNNIRTQFFKTKCSSRDSIYNGEFYVNKTDSMIYEATFTLSSSSGTDGYLAIYDDYDTLVMKVSAHGLTSRTTFFSLFHPISQHDSVSYKSDNVDSDWMTNTYDYSNWSKINFGQSKEPSEQVQYYIKEFDISNLYTYAAYTLGLLYTGECFIYLNGYLIWNANKYIFIVIKTNTQEMIYSKIVLSTAALLEHNRLSISVSSPSANQYLDMYISLFYSNEDEQCAYTLDKFSLSSSSSSSSSSSLSNIMDFKVLTRYSDNFYNTTAITFTILLNNTYIQINDYIMFEGTILGASPCSFDLTGRNNDDEEWTILDVKEDYPIRSYSRETQLFANTKAYSQYQFKVNQVCTGTKISLSDIYLRTCGQSSKGLIYPANNYDFAMNIPIPVVMPLYSGYSSIHVSPDLPTGIHLNRNTGLLYGTPTSVSESVLYTFTVGSLPISTQMFISVHYCQGVLVKIYRDYSNKASLSESFSLYNQLPNQYSFIQEPYIKPRNGGIDIFDVCLPKTDYILDLHLYSMSGSTSWADNSYFAVYLAPNTNRVSYNPSDLSNYIQILRCRYDVMLTNTYSFSTNFLLRGGDQWRYSSSFPPSNWINPSFDDSKWELISVSETPIPPTAHFYRHSIQFNSTIYTNTKDIINLFISYKSGIIIYINGEIVFSNRIKDISPDTHPSSSYTDIIYRRITIPLSVFHEGNNIICVAVIPELNDEASYTFDIAMTNVGNGPSYSIYHTIATPGTENLYRYQYMTTTHVNITEHPSICVSSSIDEFSYTTFYAMTVSSSSHPITWDLQARHHVFNTSDDESWITLDHKESIDYSYLSSRRLFFTISPIKRGIYNEYRLTNIISSSSSSPNIYDLNSFELFTSPSPPSPLFNYTSKGYTYKGTYMDQMIPKNYVYYHDYLTIPTLPEGVSIDSITGMIRGIPAVIPNSFEYTIHAKDVEDQEYSQQITVGIMDCKENHDLWTVQYIYNNRNREVSTSLTSETVFLKANGINNKRINNPYNDYEDPSIDITHERIYTECLPFGRYILTIEDEKNALKYPYGYTIYNSEKSLIYTSSLHKEETKKQYIIDTTLPIQSGVTEWSYLTSNSYPSSDWTKRSYDIKSWPVTKESIIKHKEQSNLFLRTYFSLYNITRYSSVNIYMKCNSKVIVYFNSHILYSYSDGTSTVHDHHFSIPLQNNYIKTENNILAIWIMTTIVPSEGYIFNFDMSYNNQPYSAEFRQFQIYDESSTETNHTAMNMFDNNYLTSTIFTGMKQQVTLVFGEHVMPISRFNSLYIQTLSDNIPETITIKGRNSDSEDWFLLLNKHVIEQKHTLESIIDIPMGMVMYTYISITFNEDQISIHKSEIVELSFVYTPYSGPTCYAIDGYYATGEDTYSYKYCSKGYEGLMSRYCDGIDFEKEDSSKCIVSRPSHLSYSQSTYILYTYTSFDSIVPSYNNIIQTFTIEPDLAEGLIFNTTTGVISGVSKQLSQSTEYTITGKNSRGFTSCTLSLIVESGICPSYNGFSQTNLFEYTSIPCPSGYIGIQNRHCILNSEQTQIIWGDIEDNCTNIWVYIGTIATIVLIIVLITVVIFTTFINKKRKAEIKRLRSHIATSVVKQTY